MGLSFRPLIASWRPESLRHFLESSGSRDAWEELGEAQSSGQLWVNMLSTLHRDPALLGHVDWITVFQDPDFQPVTGWLPALGGGEVNHTEVSWAPLVCAAGVKTDRSCHLNHHGPNSTCPQPQAMGIPAGAGWRPLFAHTPQPVLRKAEIMKGGRQGGT